ncbi:hypothetical protein RFI_25890 [Reticulomyxa filosa]|uniref:Uncharacterized protein n=1 Tax=Reticulomyxa filosa TaxID=46433 RepID=X6MDI6_RETFI|nr:hypothetical protein RFI_25890 [Reticulomyxa filosa]|eukprot:ETO11482.1 hypothetical protein RFI_25890 [Reticulomyxa filosa]
MYLHESRVIKGLSASQMAQLEKNFRNENENGDGLDIDQFVKVFEKVLFSNEAKNSNEGSDNAKTMLNDERERYLRHLFMKIDANSDGNKQYTSKINKCPKNIAKCPSFYQVLKSKEIWFFCYFPSNLEQYVLLNKKYVQLNDVFICSAMNSHNPDWDSFNHHESPITRILRLPHLPKFLTSSRDGLIKIWDANTLQLRRTILNSPHSWVVDMAYLPLSRRLATCVFAYHSFFILQHMFYNDQSEIIHFFVRNKKSFLLGPGHKPLTNSVNFYDTNGWKLTSQISNNPYIPEDRSRRLDCKFPKEENKWLISSEPVCLNVSTFNNGDNRNDGIDNINSRRENMLNDKELLTIGTQSGKGFLYIFSPDWHLCSGDQSVAPNQVGEKKAFNIINKFKVWGYEQLMTINKTLPKGFNNDSLTISSDSGSSGNGSFGTRMNDNIKPMLVCSHIRPCRLNVTPIVLDIHTDWITQAQYIPDLLSLATSSLDGEIRFTDIEKRKKSKVYTGHSHGVYAFAYSAENKFIASCGVERKMLKLNLIVYSIVQGGKYNKQMTTIIDGSKQKTKKDKSLILIVAID